jgi:Glyoxalase-like domain
MSTELDHIFIMCEVEAPEAAALTRIGLVEGPANVHPGQGTACRRFSFPRQYFELLWVRDRAEAQSETTAPTRLWARWSARRHGACPFGLVFRPGADAVARPPFPTWSYTPSYLPGGLAIKIAVDTPIAEPEFLFLPFLRFWRGCLTRTTPCDPGHGDHARARGHSVRRASVECGALGPVYGPALLRTIQRVRAHGDVRSVCRWAHG